MQEIYQAVAGAFAQRIHEVFASEEAMANEFKKTFERLEFNRTDHASVLVYSLFRGCWYAFGPEVKSEPTGFDRLSILRYLYSLLDYNLFTQVLLNLQTYTG